MYNLIIHIIVSYDQNISLIFYVKDGSNVRLRHPSCVYIIPPRDTAVQKIGYTSDIAFFAFQPGTNLIESDFCSRTAELEISIALFTCSLKKGCFEKPTGDLSIQTFFSQTLEH